MSIAIAASRATASASEISDRVQPPGSARCRPSTPITRSNATIGVASDGALAAVDQLADVAERRIVQLRRIEHVADRDRAALASRQVDAGRRLASPRAARPGASHSASTGIGSPGSPRRMKQRSTCAAFAVSWTATRRSSSRSRRERSCARDPRDQPLALERVCDSVRGARALERETRLGRERLHQRELVELEERADGGRRRRRRRSRRRERASGTKAQLLTRAIAFKPLVHDRRALRVVDGEGGAPRARRC